MASRELLVADSRTRSTHAAPEKTHAAPEAVVFFHHRMTDGALISVVLVARACHGRGGVGALGYIYICTVLLIFALSDDVLELDLYITGRVGRSETAMS